MVEVPDDVVSKVLLANALALVMERKRLRMYSSQYVSDD